MLAKVNASGPGDLDLPLHAPILGEGSAADHGNTLLPGNGPDADQEPRHTRAPSAFGAGVLLRLLHLPV